jgi:hypothetical protein
LEITGLSPAEYDYSSIITSPLRERIKVRGHKSVHPHLIAPKKEIIFSGVSQTFLIIYYNA